LSAKVISKDLVLAAIDLLSSNEVLELLTDIKGIGKWTTESFLIFSLGHLYVMSFGDAWLKRSIK